MCGLFGVVSDVITKKDEDIFAQLAVVSSLRGQHSTGIAAIQQTVNTNNFFFSIAKAVGNPFNLFDTKRFERAIDMYNKRVLIGHCRYATKGKINESNAHPFNINAIIGAHNGTIDGGLENMHHYGTDSECALAGFDKTGVEDVVPKLTGAWAFTWYDERNNSINFLNNGKRTLFYALDKWKRTMYYASEMEMLDLVLSRNNIDYEDDVYSFVPDTLYTYDLKAKDKWFQTEETKEIKGKEVAAQTVIPFRDTEVDTARTSGTNTKTIIQEQPSIKNLFSSKPPKEYQVRSIGGIKKGRNSLILSNDRYNSLLDNGCCWCGSKINIGEKFHWINQEDVLCEDCTSNPMARQEITYLYPAAFI